MKKYELPPVEQLKDFIITEGKARRKYSSVLEKYFCMETISKDQFLAGSRIYKDAYIGGLFSNQKGIDPTRFFMPRSEGVKVVEMSYQQADAHKRFSDAFYSEGLGAMDREIIWHTAICDNELINFNKNTAITKFLLVNALEELNKYYKKKKNEYYNKQSNFIG